jgi:hypothetical protein
MNKYKIYVVDVDVGDLEHVDVVDKPRVMAKRFVCSLA